MLKNFKINIFLFLLLFLIISYNVNAYAMTEEEFSYYFDLYADNILSNENQSFIYTQKIKDLKSSILIKFNALTNLSDYNSVLFNMSNADNNPPDRFIVFLFKKDFITFYNQSTNLSITTTDNNYYSFISVVALSSNANRIESGSYNSNKLFYFGNSDTFNFYASNVACLTNLNSPLPNLSQFVNNSITLTAFSGKKFTFNDKNQLNVNLTGTYTTSDFSFYVQKLNDGLWENFSSDYYILSNYQNPYYITFNNINYFPAGIYRYVADYHSLGTQLSYSNEFQILSNTINNPITGTVDNGNINININSGETIDNIKDYLGQKPTVTDDQLKDSFPTVEVDDPTNDFFTWIFEQVQNVFTSTMPQTFEFSLFSGTTYKINSNDIKTPEGPLKTFVALSISFSIFYYILKDVRKIINKVKEGNIEELAEEDITANMV